MPIYQYVEGGRTVERIVPVEYRDSFPGRVPVPVRVRVCPRGIQQQAHAVLGGLYKMEQKFGNRFDSMFPFDKKTTRRAWEKNRSTDN